MKAMIFAAGLGTRLRPLTNDKPKALVELNGKPVIEHIISKLVQHDFNEIIVNVHHFSSQMINFLDNLNIPGLHIAISDERDQLLDTGGGLNKAGWFFNDGNPFLIYNVDIISSIDLTKLYTTHINNMADITLVVSNRKSDRVLLFDAEDQFCGWRNNKTREQNIVRNQVSEFKQFPFSGIHVMNSNILDLIEEEGRFSIIKLYLRLANLTSISYYYHENDFWIDIGKPENIVKAEHWLKTVSLG